MSPIDWVGLSAGFLTSGAAIPQVAKTYRTKHARDLSMCQLVLLDLGMLLWLVYGASIGDLPLVLANTFSICCYTGLIGMKLNYDRRESALPVSQ